MRRKRIKQTPSSYHGSGGDYRNVAIPNILHKRVAHIAIDLEISISEIASVLLEEFCGRVESGAFDLKEWQKIAEDESKLVSRKGRD